MEVSEVIAACSRFLDRCDGFTVTGGEPFEQPEALAELLAGLRSMHAADILVFSGKEREDLLGHPVVVSHLIDVLVSGPYRPEAGQTLTLRGSDNQIVDLLTPLARQRYPDDINEKPWESPRHLDFFPTETTLFMAGIPEVGWGEEFRLALAERGIECRTSEQ